MRNLIILAAAILLYFLAFRWFARQPRKTRIQTLMVIAGVVLVGLAAAGRLNWVFALFWRNAPVRPAPAGAAQLCARFTAALSAVQRRLLDSGKQQPASSRKWRPAFSG